MQCIRLSCAQQIPVQITIMICLENCPTVYSNFRYQILTIPRSLVCSRYFSAAWGCASSFENTSSENLKLVFNTLKSFFFLKGPAHTPHKIFFIFMLHVCLTGVNWAGFSWKGLMSCTFNAPIRIQQHFNQNLMTVVGEGAAAIQN